MRHEIGNHNCLVLAGLDDSIMYNIVDNRAVITKSRQKHALASSSLYSGIRLARFRLAVVNRRLFGHRVEALSKASQAPFLSKMARQNPLTLKQIIDLLPSLFLDQVLNLFIGMDVNPGPG